MACKYRWAIKSFAVCITALLMSASAHAGDEDFWIGETGPTGPIFTGPHQFPFICWTVESNLGQPLVDNQDGIGNAVFPEINRIPDFAAEPVGFSRNCSMKTRVDYFYYNGTRFLTFHPETDFAFPPPDLKTVTLRGITLPFVVRVEAGTINRFIYTIAFLAPFPEDPASPETLNNSAWNEKLIYFFRGGVGIGHWQGEAAWHGGLSSAERAMFPVLLARGFAIATSSGNTTGVHYNLRLAEETAMMVKDHFEEVYDDPEYTVGLGGSGGAVQQYVIGQNNDDILDAGIPLLSYPDMITQAIHIPDCNLLEQYFLEEVIADPNSLWATWANRKSIEGLNTSNTVTNSIFGTPGSSECIEGWLFAEPLVFNPATTDAEYFNALRRYRYPAEVIASIKWTHWNDLKNIYGEDQNGFAPIPFDNEGVQYGLQALIDGRIPTMEFLKINACVGSWKEQADYVAWNPAIDPFDATNTNRNPLTCRAGIPSPRRSGDLVAMNKAYSSGHVFTGDIEIPLIDLRPYLEPVLDMHNSRQSFSARQRMINSKGDADNQVIWFAGSEVAALALIVDALAVLDELLTSDTKPATFVDRCFDASGKEIASDSTVWDGILNSNSAGACTTAYPIFSSSRVVAGDSISGDMFKCALKPVSTALTDGTYGGVAFAADEIALLNGIFPTGVCDYSQPDVGKPEGF